MDNVVKRYITLVLLPDAVILGIFHTGANAFISMFTSQAQYKFHSTHSLQFVYCSTFGLWYYNECSA